MFVDIEPAEEPLPPKEWHKHLANMLELGQVNPDILPLLDYKQQWCINEIKKYYKRKEYKNGFIPETKYSKGAGTKDQAPKSWKK